MEAMDKMKLKDKLLQELMEEAEGHEAMAIKPKDKHEEMVAIEVKPRSGMSSNDGAAMEENEPCEGSPKEEEMDDEELKQLMQDYMARR